MTPKPDYSLTSDLYDYVLGLSAKPCSIDKLQIEFIDEDDGSATIRIEWDEEDPDLQWWTDLGPQGQEKFLIDALYEACSCYVD